jgi:EAL and modified HD-GYP domain-containing signal transduction protein
MEVFVARQPIFDRSRRTYAYELLFRAARTDAFEHPDPDVASLRVIDTAFFLIGAKRITGRRRAFVNMTRDTLVKGYAGILPSPSIVIEVLESVVADAEVIEACRALRKTGHLIALDDVAPGAWSPELLKVADIVKVDFAQTDPAGRRDLARRFRLLGLRLVAEKVETEDDFRQALEAGYDYFQGYFFSKPSIVTSRDVPTSRLNLLRLLHTLNQPDADLGQIEAIIKCEVSLSLKLLTYMNLAAFAFRQRVMSVQQALLLLGVNGIRKWASVIALADAGGDKPFELVVASVVRAKFCEQLAVDARLGAEPAFFMGLFSMLDALLGRPLPELLDALAMAEDVRHALLGGMNALRRIYEVVLAYERGDWDAVVGWAASLGLDPNAIPGRYFAAVEWGNSTSRMEPSI